MVTIKKIGNSVEIDINGVKNIHPLSSLISHVDNNSNSVDIKYRASRRTAYSFNYKELTVPSATDAKDAQSKIANILE